MIQYEDLCQFIYNNPELGFEEVKAAEIQQKFLEERGFCVKYPYSSKLKTAFRTEYGTDEPTVLFMSEYDALKGLGHACGHNLIATAAIKAFMETAEYLKKNNIPGKAILLGTPAEEGYGGKVYLIDEHAFDGADVAFVSHPFHVAGIGPSTMGISHLQVEFFGKSAHASMAPEHGINALDAMIALFNAVGLYRQQMSETCQIHGVIINGGTAPNIIPDYTKAYFYTRSHVASDHAKIDEDFQKMAEGAAMMTKCTFKISNSSPRYESSRINTPLQQVTLENMQSAGLEIADIDQRLSSDFGNVSNILPTVNVFFPVSENSAPKLHTTEFLKAAGTHYAFEQSIKAGCAMAKTAVRFFEDAKFRQDIADNR